MDYPTLFYVETLPEIGAVFGNVNLCEYQTLDLSHFCKINGTTLTLYDYAGNLLWSVTKAYYNDVGLSPAVDNTPTPVLRNVYIAGNIMIIVAVPGNGSAIIDKWDNGVLVSSNTYSGPPSYNGAALYLLNIVEKNAEISVIILAIYYSIVAGKLLKFYAIYEALSANYFFIGQPLNTSFGVTAFVLVNSIELCIYFTNINYGINTRIMDGQFYDLLTTGKTIPFSVNNVFCGSFFGSISSKNISAVNNSYSSMPLSFGLFNLVSFPVVFPPEFVDSGGTTISTANGPIAGGFFINGYPSYYLQQSGIYYLFQPKMALSQYKIGRNFAHNYSRGVPINQGTQNLILPPNRNIIL